MEVPYLQRGDLNVLFKSRPIFPEKEIKEIENIFNKKYESVGWKLTIVGQNFFYSPYSGQSTYPFYLSYMDEIVLEISFNYIFKFRVGFIPEEILKVVMKCLNSCKPLIKQHEEEYQKWQDEYNSQFTKGSKDDGK